MDNLTNIVLGSIDIFENRSNSIGSIRGDICRETVPGALSAQRKLLEGSQRVLSSQTSHRRRSTVAREVGL